MNGGWMIPDPGPCRVEREWRLSGACRKAIECSGGPAAVLQPPAFVAPNRGPLLNIAIPFD